jgi:ankyrin repeat protein
MVRPNRRRGGARLSGRAAAGLAHQEGATMRISRLVPALLVVLLLSTSAGAQLNPFGAYYSNIARAAASNDAARVNELVGLGSNPNETDDSGYAGLHYAAMNGNLPMIAVLIKAGARIDQRDRLGNTPLALAAARGQDAAAELLIAAGADVNARNGDGVTPLMIAARRGDLDLVRALLARGADPRMLDYTGHDAANWAADSHRPAVVAAIRRALAEAKR